MAAANVNHQTIFTGDNLPILRGMNSESVDLIYLDPPFNSKADYAAPIGSQAAGAAFKDTWGLDDVNLAWHGEIKHENPGLYMLLEATREIHGDSMMSYLIYMSVRVMEMRRVLKSTGSLYLHCDSTASHYLKLLLDCTFGREHFQNEIVWSYRRWPSKSQKFQTMHDIILLYGKTPVVTFNVEYEDVSESYTKRFKGKTQVLDPETKTRKIVINKATKGMPMRDVWELSILAGSSKERLGYPTQKPLALLERIIKASSNEGDVVLDPFCGCATACVAAEMLARNWIGIDISSLAVKLCKQRLDDASQQGKLARGLLTDPIPRTDVPLRTDLGKVIPYNDPKNKRWLYGEQGGYCNGCENHFQIQHLTVDHIIAKSNGGTDHISNLQLLCGHCNSVKGTRTQEELLLMLTDKGWIKRKKAA